MSGEPTFAPPVNPSFPIRIKRAPKVMTVPFGDGYAERVSPGINSNSATVSLTWENLTESERDEIIDFFEDRAGHEAFLYQPRGFSAAKKWICQQFDDELTNPDAWTISATLNQVFDP